jgi:glycosyltransferase involved in cell wall biosynthesis
MTRIKIAIIAHNCRAGGGLIGTLNLLKGLKKVARGEQFMLVHPADCGFEEIKLPSNGEHFVYEGSHSPLERYWFERVTLPAIVDRYNPDVILGAANIGLVNPPAPQALIIRQAYLFYGKKHCPGAALLSRLRNRALKSQVTNSLAATSLIFCQTPVVKRRFSEIFRYPANRINVMRWPPPAEVKRQTDQEAPSVFNTSSGDFFVLVLTRYMPHRNPSVLIPLCERYERQIRARQIKFITAVEVRDDTNAGRFLKEVSKRCLEDLIINVGHLSRADVVRYYSHSHLLWLPTLMETLGLPFLEAMTMGVPILAPDLDFARYVCGEAAVFYDPWDVNSIFEKIMMVREDAFLRRELIEKGKIQLSDRTKFAENWDEVAVSVIKELRRLVKGN